MEGSGRWLGFPVDMAKEVIHQTLTWRVRARWFGGRAAMNDQKFAPNHAKHLADLVESLRPDWDRPGIAAAIWKARDKGSAIDVCVAAVKACVISNRTPAVIPLDGNHWRETPPAVTSQSGGADKGFRCEACGIVHTAQSPCSPPDQRSHGRGAVLAREALAAARRSGGSCG